MSVFYSLEAAGADTGSGSGGWTTALRGVSGHQDSTGGQTYIQPMADWKSTGFWGSRTNALESYKVTDVALNL